MGKFIFHVYFIPLICMYIECVNLKIGLFASKNCCYNTTAFETSAGAISLALEDAQRHGFFANHTWSVHIDFTSTAADMSRRTVELITNIGVDVILGHPASKQNTPVAYVTSAYNYPHVSWLSGSVALSNKTVFKTLIRLRPTFKTITEAVFSMLHHFNWTIISVLIEHDDDECTYVAEGITDFIQTSPIDLKIFARFQPTVTDELLIRKLSDIRKGSRIVIVCGSDYNLRQIMLQACRLDMCNGDFVFIDPKFSSDMTYSPWKNNDADDIAALKAFQHVLHLSYALWYNNQSKIRHSEIRAAVPVRTAQPPWNDYYAINNNLSASPFSVFLYDCAYLIAMWWDHALSKSVDVRDGMAMYKWALNTTFNGASGKVRFDKNADPDPMLWIEDLKGSGEQKRVLGIVETNKPLNERVTLWRNPLWRTSDGRPPPSSPVCGFEGELCPPKSSTIDLAALLGGLAAGLVCLTVAIVLVQRIIRKRALAEKIVKMTWRIDYADIVPEKRKEGTGSFPSKPSVDSRSKQSVFTNSTVCKDLTATYNGQPVFMKMSSFFPIRITRKEMINFTKMKEFNHSNINPFIGACIEPPNVCSVFAYGQKGSLQGILENDEIKLEWLFKLSLIKDLIAGMIFLHGTVLKSHGKLKSTNCVIDGRWTLKITDYGISFFHTALYFRSLTHTEQYHALLWTAPEILRHDLIDPEGTAKGDVYSFSIILHEICYRSGVFPVPVLTPKDIVGRVKNQESMLCRPPLMEEAGVPPEMCDLMKKCWDEDPDARPDFKTIFYYIKRAFPEATKGIMDTMLMMLERYANNLEDLVQERTIALDEEKEKTDLLLYKMIPKAIAERLKRGEITVCENFDWVTVCFSDVVGFTRIAAEITPNQVVQLLNELYTLFDDILSRFDVYKVETIGDAYMVASGLPVPNGDQHAGEIADMSITFLKELKDFDIKALPGRKINIRIGIHTGAVCAGVIGITMPRYCLFGDTVNTASRMESNGLPQKIHLTQTTKRALEFLGGYMISRRGEINIKGKGAMVTYWLDGKDDVFNIRADIDPF